MDLVLERIKLKKKLIDEERRDDNFVKNVLSNESKDDSDIRRKLIGSHSESLLDSTSSLT